MTGRSSPTPAPHDAGCTLHPDVVWVARPDGSSRLVHMGRDMCAIDANATILLNSLLDVGREACIATLDSRFGIGPARAREDLDTFIADLRQRKVLRLSTDRDGVLDGLWNLVARCAIRAGLGLSAVGAGSRRARVLGLLWTAKAAIVWFGWARAVREWQRAFPQPEAGAGPGAETLDAIDRAVRAAAARSLIAVECKERSLACLAMARVGGMPARLVVGLTYFPLAGHVWVEAGGRVISDVADHCRRFDPIASYG